MSEKRYFGLRLTLAGYATVILFTLAAVTLFLAIAIGIRP
jgi:hypothetical protein